MKLPETFYNGPALVGVGSRNVVDVDFYTKDPQVFGKFLSELTYLLIPIVPEQKTEKETFLDDAITQELELQGVPVEQKITPQEAILRQYAALIKQSGQLVDIEPKDLKLHVQLPGQIAQEEPVIYLPSDVFPTVSAENYRLVLNSRSENFTVDKLFMEVNKSSVQYEIGRHYKLTVYPKPKFPFVSPEYRGLWLRVYHGDRLTKDTNIGSVVERLKEWMPCKNLFPTTFDRLMKDDMTFDDVSQLAGFIVQR